MVSLPKKGSMGSAADTGLMGLSYEARLIRLGLYSLDSHDEEAALRKLVILRKPVGL